MKPPTRKANASRTPSSSPADVAGPWSGSGAAGLQAAAIVGLALLAHAIALPGNFIWEDCHVILETNLLQRPDAFSAIWWSTEVLDYWPVAYTTHWFEWHIWGDWAPGYRALNLALHALNAVLVWRVLALLGIRGAWLCGALFAVHPVTVEAVAWILQRKTVLSAACAFGALWFYLRFYEAQRWRWYAAALLLFALGMLSKTAVALWPVVLLGCRWWQTKKLTSRDVWLALPFFAATAVLSAVAMYFQRYVAIGNDPVRDDGFVSRMLLAGDVVWFYVGKALWPVDLSFVYPRWQLEPQGMLAWLPDTALVVLFALLWWFRGTWGRGPLAALGYYVANLVPVLGLVNIYYMRYSLVADHWQYLALPGLIALVVASTASMIERIGSRLLYRAACTFAAGVLVFFIVLSGRQSNLYGQPDNDALWNDVIAKNPTSWLPHYWLGRDAEDRGELVDAERHLREAVLLDPQHGDLRNNLAVVLVKEEKCPEAIAELRTALDVDPHSAAVHANLGKALLLVGQVDEGLSELREAVRLEPASGGTRKELALALVSAGDMAAALEEFRQVLQSSPRDADAHANLGNLLARLGKVDQALAEYDQALALAPDNLLALEGLARQLITAGKVNEAVARYDRALVINPNSIELRMRYAATLAAAGRLDEAIVAYRRVVSLEPDNAVPLLEIARALKMQNKHEDAIGELREIVARHPNHAEVRAVLAAELSVARLDGEAIAQFREALRLEPKIAADKENLSWANNLAWLLATSRDPSLRDGAEAVRVALAAVAASNEGQFEALDTLAAAYAEAGQFENAATCERRFIDRVLAARQSAGDHAVQRQLDRQVEEGRSRLRLYESSRPYHQD